MAGQQTNGVLALNSRAGTPSPLAPPADSAALATLEFHAAVAIVAGYASGPLGAERVRARRPMTDVDQIRDELNLVAEGLRLLRAGDGLEIVPAPEIEAALGRLRIQGSVLDGSDLVGFQGALTAARQVARELRRVSSRAPRLGLLEVAVPDPRIERRLELSLAPDGELLDGASPALAAARRAVHTARERVVRKLESMLRTLDSQAAPAGATVTMRGGRYVIPVRRDSRARPPGIVHDESGSAGTLFIEPTDAIDLGNELREAIVEESRETLRVLRELTELLRPHLETIREAQAMCVAADDAAARARYAHAVGAEVPEVGPPGGPIAIVHGRHPVLLAASGAAVPFDLTLGTAERTLLISGPNAGGKTVLLKAVGLCGTMVQSGIVPPVGAESVFPVFTSVFADIGDHQSIEANLSTFSAHVAMLRRILDTADDGTLVLLDEVGSGTDPAEGGALAWATLENLTSRRTLTLATTHLGSLKTLASHVPGVVNGSLEFDASTLSPTYRFQKGVPGRSYGLAIARRLGVDPAVLERAERQVPEGDLALDRLLHEVETRDQVLRERERDLATQLEDATRRTADLSSRLESAEVREKDLRRRERDAEQRARAQAREYLLDARKRVEEAIERATAARGEEDAREARRLVEEGIQAGASALDREAVGQPAPGGTDGQGFTPGQRVRLGTGSIARVEALRADGRIVVRAGSVRMVLLPDAIEAGVGEAPKVPTSRAPDRATARVSEEPAMEIDLRGMRVDEAEAVALSALDAAILADHPFLRIIHGKGTGAVRERVHQLLQGDRRVARFALAPANQGGSGATLVEFRQ
jgi:DNA mismatch repair protein MutS2